MEKKFVQVHNHVIHIDSIGYVDFLESGRAMIFVRGLTAEKQNITVDPAEAARLKSFLDTLMTPLPEPPPSRGPAPRQW